jgi:hypothetical protein
MQNTNFNKVIFGSYFILSLAPIGIETSILSNNFENITSIFNLFRLIVPLFIFLILFFFILRKLNMVELKKTFFLFIFFISVFASTLFNLENSNEAQKLLLPFYCINYILLCSVAFNTTNFKNKFNKFFFLQFVIITIITLFSLSQFLSFFINFSLPDLYNLRIENSFYNQNSNGLSRVLLIISLFIFLMNKKNKYFYMSCLIVNTIIILLQSKLVLFFLFSFILLTIFLKKNIIKEKMKDVFFILLVPLLITFFISTINAAKDGPKIRLITQAKSDIGNSSSNQILNLTIFTSLKTRIDTWKVILKNSEKPLAGYGSQADKYLTRNLPKHTQLAANSFIYAYACAGIIGIISLIIIYYNIIKLLFSTFFLNKSKNKFNDLKLFYFAILCFLIFRSIFENSFVVWGIDFVLLINCYFGLKSIIVRKSFHKKIVKAFI